MPKIMTSDETREKLRQRKELKDREEKEAQAKVCLAFTMKPVADDILTRTPRSPSS